MKVSKLAFKIGAVVLAITIGGTVIWWRDQVNREKFPWKYPENHARILAEARIHGEAIKVIDEQGNAYYLMGSSKHGWLIKPDEIHYGMLSRHNRYVTDGDAGHQGSMGYEKWWSKKHLYTKYKPEGDLKVVPVEPGTTVEELMAREGEVPQP